MIKLHRLVARRAMLGAALHIAQGTEMLNKRVHPPKTFRVIAASALLSVIAACSTPTRYEPAVKRGESGFTESRIEQNRYRITFRGGSGAPAWSAGLNPSAQSAVTCEINRRGGTTPAIRR